MESAADVEQLHSALGNREYWLARLAAFGGKTTLESLTVDDGGTVTVVTSQDLGRQALPAMLASVLPGHLKLRRTETWQPVGRRQLSGEVSVWTPGGVVSAAGAASMEPVEAGSRVSFSATVEVKVPVVGGKIEQIVCEQVADEIREMHGFTEGWITEHGDGR